tara:strand:- start:1618 stop:1923 length:306 start_codon:yes stop_codon:yes gene_type:complete
MDLKQKYFVAEVFEVDDDFLESLEAINEGCQEDILNQLHTLCMYLENNKNVQNFAGVSHSDGQLFFEVSVLKEHKKHPYFMDINEISSDDYLDYMILSKAI